MNVKKIIKEEIDNYLLDTTNKIKKEHPEIFNELNSLNDIELQNRLEIANKKNKEIYSYDSEEERERERNVEYVGHFIQREREHMSLSNIYNVPVDFMWEYREFDRCSDDNIWGDKYIKNLIKDIKENGIKTPITLTVNYENIALITEGNHRLCIAKMLGIDKILVKVINSELGSNKHKAKKIDYSMSKWKRGDWD